MDNITQYGLLGFVQALQLVLRVGLTVPGWILCHKFGAPVPSAVPSASTRQVLNLSIIDGLPVMTKAHQKVVKCCIVTRPILAGGVSGSGT